MMDYGAIEIWSKIPLEKKNVFGSFSDRV